MPSRGIIEKSGAWYSYKKQRLGQGREASKAYLKEHPEVFAEIYEELKKSLALAEHQGKVVHASETREKTGQGSEGEANTYGEA
jgi:recombination protein RecA